MTGQHNSNERYRSGIGRRQVLRGLGAAGLGIVFGRATQVAASARPVFDVLVVGAGVIGVWTAARLHAEGRRVAVIEAQAPGHSRASSGGESRVTRCGYGDAGIYSEWAWQSLRDWQALSDRAALPLLHRLGVLWLHESGDPLVEASRRTLSAQGIPFEMVTAAELERRYPAMRVGSDEAGFLEPAGGGLMARRAVQQLAGELGEAGVTFLSGTVRPLRNAQAERGALRAVRTVDGRRIEAERFVMACGPWLDRVCPDAMSGRLFVTRQEVHYFAADPADTGRLPVWADLPFYGLPDLEGRGFKVADDAHGPALDPDTADRRASEAGEMRAREFLARRFPAIAEAPLSETRVCQYENSSDGNLLIDRHPGFDNVWLAGCGSGHAFKLGPAVGTHVADLVAGRSAPRAPFLLGSKQTRPDRAVQ
jgi:glycine/D-amino acid oxidase-like deaminating enzyme